MLLLGFCATLVSVASLAWLGPQAQLRRRLGGVRAFALPSIEELTTSATAAPVPTIGDFDELGSDDFDHGPVGVLLLTKGAPETPDDVEQYLVNVFCDPEILTLPPSLSLFKRPLAAFIAKSKAEEARVAMEIAGGRSPQMTTIRAQADALQLQLAERGVDARLYIAARYWSPYADEVIEDMKREGIQKLVIIPIYPQFSISTSGSSLRVLEQLMYTDPGFPAKSSVVPAWYNRRGFLEATAEGIQQTLVSLPDPEKAHVLYTAQGLPRKYIDDLNDPYQGQVEHHVLLSGLHLLTHSPLWYAGGEDGRTSDQGAGGARRGQQPLAFVPGSARTVAAQLDWPFDFGRNRGPRKAREEGAGASAGHAPLSWLGEVAYAQTNRLAQTYAFSIGHLPGARANLFCVRAHGYTQRDRPRVCRARGIRGHHLVCAGAHPPAHTEPGMHFAHRRSEVWLLTSVNFQVPTLGVAPKFVDMLATVVMEALPDLSRASFSQECYSAAQPYTYLIQYQPVQ